MSTRLLTTLEMARFVTDGYLRFDGVVPEDVNRAALEQIPEIGRTPTHEPSPLRPRSGTPLSHCYPAESAIRQMLETPEVAGAIRSLVGNEPRFDHAWVHENPAGSTGVQGLHADAAIDSVDPTFDIQVFYFPHAVGPAEGGTRFVAGTHLRRVHESSVSRYQHMSGDSFFEGPGGTVLVFHQGLWHAGQANPSAQTRWMYKVRLNPTVPQVRLWDTSDYDNSTTGPWDHMFANIGAGDTVAGELRRIQPWSFMGEYRLEVMERVRLWRYLSGDHDFDVDWYHTRIEQRAGLLAQETNVDR